MNKLTFAYWIKNEAPYLAEYIEFHLLQGVDNFIFYDNGSTDETREVLSPYIQQGIVELRTYPPEVVNRNNFWMMTHLINELKGKSEWLHFHAIDERVYGISKPLNALLDDYTEFGGLCVGWEEFNSNGHLNKSSGLITDRFTTTCKDTTQHIKTIIRPEVTLNHGRDPHHFKFINGLYSVDENKNRVDGPWNKSNPYTFNVVKNHHYRTLSREEFDRKMSKGLLDHAGQENIRRIDADQQWDWCHNRAELGHNNYLSTYSVDVKHNIQKRFKDLPIYSKMKIWYDLT